MPATTWSSAPWTVTGSSSVTTALYYPSVSMISTNTTLSNLEVTWTYAGNTIRAPSFFQFPTFGTLGTPAPLRPPRTPEQDAALEATRMARAEQRRLDDLARGASRTRARDILLAVLDETQRAQYLAHETFDVIGSAGNRYRINRGSAGNVDYLDPITGAVLGRLCAHPSMSEHWLPDQDVALAQLLALTSDEPAFIRLANVHRGIRPPILVAA